VSIPDPFEQDDAALMAGFLDWVYDEPLSIVATQAERISTLEALTDQLAEALLAFSPHDAPSLGVALSLESVQRHALRAYEADKEAHR
jgi:hypothetical protein